MLEVLTSGDRQKIEELGRNICETRGIDPQQAAMQAQSFFGNMFGQRN